MTDDISRNNPGFLLLFISEKNGDHSELMTDDTLSCFFSFHEEDGDHSELYAIDKPLSFIELRS